MASGAAADRGLALANRNCAGCHAVGQDGASPLAAAPPFRQVSTQFDQTALAEHLREIAATGYYKMPAGRLRQDEVEDLTAYINGLETPAGS